MADAGMRERPVLDRIAAALDRAEAAAAALRDERDRAGDRAGAAIAAGDRAVAALDALLGAMPPATPR